MTWDPYGMPNTPSGQFDDDGNRSMPEPQPVKTRTVLAVLAAMVLLALVFSLAAEAQEATGEPQDSQTVIDQQDQQSVATGTTQATEDAAQGAESAEAAPMPVDGQIVEQPEGTYAASDLIGRSVMSAEGEEMGRISDLLIGEDAAIQGVMVGIGGFLGIGEKVIAIEFDRISRTTTQDGAEQLAEFVSLADLKRQQEAEQARQEQEQMQKEAEQQLQQQGSGQSTAVTN